jgi:hypothetical protein
MRALSIVPVVIFSSLIVVILASSPAKLVTLIADGNLTLCIVPVAILVAVIFVILETLPVKLVTLIPDSNLALSIVPVILVVSRSGILTVVKTGICPSVNPVHDTPEPLNIVAVMVPLTSNFCSGFFPIPKLLLVMSHIKLADCVIGFVSFPIKSCPSPKVDKPVPL